MVLEELAGLAVLAQADGHVEGFVREVVPQVLYDLVEPGLRNHFEVHPERG